MRDTFRRVLAAGAAVVLTAVVLASPPLDSAFAAASVPFDIKYQTNANGAILTVGNNLQTCPSGSSCSQAQSNTWNRDSYNNDWAMVNLDVDGLSGTVNSSSSTLSLPDGAQVLWAGLYWGGRTTAGTSGAAPASGTSMNQIKFRAPGDGTTYRTVNASTAAGDLFGPDTASEGAYQRFADVTSIVQERGNGEYWGANVYAGTGYDRYAGWAMTVVYSAPGMPLRNLTVYDGFQTVYQGNPVTVQVKDFVAPPSGTVEAQLTMVVYEGDRALTGDYTMLNNTQLASAASPGSNIFNSTNERNGQVVTTRNPVHQNMLGFDVKNFGVSGAIANSATTATFRFSSNGDTYYPGVVGLAINLYAPDFSTSSKAVTNTGGNSPSRPGDTLTYSVTYNNTGLDAATGVVATDPIPANTTYVPGSLRLINPMTGATVQALTDAADTDVGRYTASNRTVTVNLGYQASGTAGGRMMCSGTASCTNHSGGTSSDGTASLAFAFDVTVDAAAGGSSVSNQAKLAYITETTETPATYDTNLATVTVVEQADVSIAKAMTLEDAPVPPGSDGYVDPATNPDDAPVVKQTTVTATLTVSNAGPNTARAVTVSDPIPAGWTNATISPAVAGCSITGGRLSCNLGDRPRDWSQRITLTGVVPSNWSATSITNVAQVTTSSYDSNPSNNISSATVTTAKSADLQVQKLYSPTLVDGWNCPTDAYYNVIDPSDPRCAEVPPAAGRWVWWVIEVLNEGPSDARNVVVTDVLDDPSQATITKAWAYLDEDPDSVDDPLNEFISDVSAAARRVPATPDGTWTEQGGSTCSVTASSVRCDATDTISLWDSRVVRIDANGDGVQDTRELEGPVLKPGQAVRVFILGQLDPTLPEGTDVVNTARGSSDTPDLDPSNNVATETITTVEPTADVRTTKTGPTSVIAGQSITWTVTATNWGPSDAENVTVTDGVPDGVSVTSVSASRGTCAVTGQDVSCTGIGTLPAIAPEETDALRPGGAVTITITGTVDGAFTGTLVNSATGETTSNDTDDPVPPQDYDNDGVRDGEAAWRANCASQAGWAIEDVAGVEDLICRNNTATWTTTVTTAYDLTIAKSSPRLAAPRTEDIAIPFYLLIGNAGPSTAKGATVVDTVPAELDPVGPITYEFPAGSGETYSCDIDGQVVTCADMPDIPFAAALRITIPTVSNIRADDLTDESPDLVQVASINPRDLECYGGDDPDSCEDTNLDNNTDTWVLSNSDTSRTVDLAILKTAPEFVTAGTQNSYGFTLLNNNDPNYEEPPGSFPGRIYSVDPKITDTLPDGVNLPGGAVTVAATQSPADPNGALTWQVTCTQDERTVVCVPSATRAGAAFDGGIYPGTRLDFAMPVVFDADLVSKAAPGDPAPLVNTAVASQNEDYPDPAPGNNIGIATSRVQGVADLQVDLSIEEPTGYQGAGSSRTIMLEITNNGPSDAEHPSFRKTRETDGIADLSALAAEGWACETRPREIECVYQGKDGDNGVLPPGGVLNVEFTLTLPGSNLQSQAATGWVDTVTVWSETPEPADDPTGCFYVGDDPLEGDSGTTPSCNVDRAGITITEPITDLTVTKTAVGSTLTQQPSGEPINDGLPSFVVGGPFTYQIEAGVTPPAAGAVTGHADAQGVVVTDWLPVGLVPEAVSTTQGTCAIVEPGDDGRYGIRCELGTLPGVRTADGATATVVSPARINVHGVVADDVDYTQSANYLWNLHNMPAGTPDGTLDGEAKGVGNRAVVTTATTLATTAPSCAATDLPTPAGEAAPAACAAADAVVDLIELSDIRLVKTADQQVVNAGGTIGFTLTLINQGPSGLEHGLVTDQFPVGLELALEQTRLDGHAFDPAWKYYETWMDDPGGTSLCKVWPDGQTEPDIIGAGPFYDPMQPGDPHWDRALGAAPSGREVYNPGGQTVTCQALAIPAGGQRSLHVTATVPITMEPTVETVVDDTTEPPAITYTPIEGASQYTNWANGDAVLWEPDGSDNQDQAAFDVAELTDVAVRAGVSSTTPAAGTIITFTGALTVNGPSDAWGNTGSATFPPGFVPVSAKVPYSTCTWDPTPPAWQTQQGPDWSTGTLGETDLPDGTFVDVEFTDPADPASGVPGEGWVSAQSEADLAATRYDPAVQYTLTCGVGDEYPTWAGYAGSNVVQMYIPRDTPTGSYRYDYWAESALTPESTYANNRDGLDVFITHISDTAVVKTLVDPAPDAEGNQILYQGQVATWQIKAYNFGPSVAENVVVSDNVPADMEFVSATVTNAGEGEGCELHQGAVAGDTTDDNPIIRCELGTLDVSGYTDTDGSGGFDDGEPVTRDLSKTVEVKFKVGWEIDLGNPACNAAMVGSSSLDMYAGQYVSEDGASDGGHGGQGDEDPEQGEMTTAGGNNWSQACAAVTESPPTDLEVAKTAVSAGPHYPGSEVTWEVVATNLGPWHAGNVVIADTPVDAAQMTLVRASLDTGGPCTVTAGHAECVAAEIAVGASATMTVTATLDPGLADGTVVRNTGTVTTPDKPEPDDTDDDNIVVEEIEVTALDVAVTVTPGTQTRESGTTATLTVRVVNDGEDTADDVRAHLFWDAAALGHSGEVSLTHAAAVATATGTGATACTTGCREFPDGTPTGSWDFALGTLAPGEWVEYTVTGVATGPDGGVLPVRAEVAIGPEAYEPMRAYLASATAPGARTESAYANNVDDAEIRLVATEPAPTPPAETPTPAPTPSPAGPVTYQPPLSSMPRTGAAILALLTAAGAAIATGTLLRRHGQAPRHGRRPEPPRPDPTY